MNDTCTPDDTTAVIETPAIGIGNLIPFVAPKNRVTLGTITGASEVESEMIRVAAFYIPKVIYSEKFRDEVLKAEFTNTNGLTNQEIYDLFINTDLVINVDDFSGTWKQNHVWHTMGYEQGDGFVHANRYFVSDALTMGSLMLHELSHEPLGFHHDSATEYTSVPYTMNQIFDIVTKFYGIQQDQAA